VEKDLSSLHRQKDRLLNLYTLGEINGAEFSAKNTEARDRIAQQKLKLEAADRGRDEEADLARKVFELSQSLSERRLAADDSAKRQILEVICLNFSLDGATLVPEWRKPFDVLVRGLSVSLHRGDSPCALHNETAEAALTRILFPEPLQFKGDEITSLVTPGLYGNAAGRRRKARARERRRPSGTAPGSTRTSSRTGDLGHGQANRDLHPVHRPEAAGGEP
jgi:hypothetical protein